jgi:hypothetical protein
VLRKPSYQQEGITKHPKTYQGLGERLSKRTPMANYNAVYSSGKQWNKMPFKVQPEFESQREVVHSAYLCDQLCQVALLGEAGIERVPGGSLAHARTGPECAWNNTARNHSGSHRPGKIARQGGCFQGALLGCITRSHKGNHKKVGTQNVCTATRSQRKACNHTSL